jgi:DNA-binding beta-propeller fold protein YncE
MKGISADTAPSFPMKALAAVSFLILICSFPGCDTESSDPFSPQTGPGICVLNTLGETLSIIDPGTDTVAKDVASAGLWPNQIVILGTRAYIVNSGDNQIQVCNVENLTSGTPMVLDPGTNPLQIAFSADGGKAYVTTFLTNRLFVFDTVTMELIDTVPFRVPSLSGVIVTEEHIYVTCIDFDHQNFSYGEGIVYALSTVTDTPVDSAETFSNPQWMALDPEGRIHVCCTGNYIDEKGKVLVMDPAGFAAIDTIDIGGTPGYIAIDSDGIAYLSSYADGIYRYDSRSGEILNGPENPVTVGIGASGIATDPDLGVYVCVMEEDAVKRIGKGGVIEGTYPVGDGPVSLDFFDSD